MSTLRQDVQTILAAGEQAAEAGTFVFNKGRGTSLLSIRNQLAELARQNGIKLNDLMLITDTMDDYQRIGRLALHGEFKLSKDKAENGKLYFMNSQASFSQLQQNINLISQALHTTPSRLLTDTELKGPHKSLAIQTLRNEFTIKDEQIKSKSVFYNNGHRSSLVNFQSSMKGIAAVFGLPYMKLLEEEHYISDYKQICIAAMRNEFQNITQNVPASELRFDNPVRNLYANVRSISYEMRMPVDEAVTLAGHSKDNQDIGRTTLKNEYRLVEQQADQGTLHTTNDAASTIHNLNQTVEQLAQGMGVTRLSALQSTGLTPWFIKNERNQHLAANKFYMASLFNQNQKSVSAPLLNKALADLPKPSGLVDTLEVQAMQLCGQFNLPCFWRNDLPEWIARI